MKIDTEESFTALHLGDYCKKNQSIYEFIDNKKQKIHYFRMQVQTLKVLADMDIRSWINS